jgi:hypothetical protein
MNASKTKAERATEVKAIAKVSKAKAKSTTVLANQANKAHTSANKTATTALNFAFDAGEALTAAKEAVKQGKQVSWAAWIKKNLTFSQRTASVYLKLFANKARIQATEFSASETVSIAAALKSLPKGKRAPSVVKQHERDVVNTSLDLKVAVSNHMTFLGVTDQKAIEAMTTKVMKLERAKRP